jgi:hypothetical protein
MSVHHLQSCETHGVVHRCGKPPATVSHIRLKASLETLARKNEGADLKGYDGSEVEIETRLTLREIGCVLVVAGVVLSVIALVLTK